MTTVEEFILHCLVLYLNHLDRVEGDLRSKNCLRKMNRSSLKYIYIHIFE